MQALAEESKESGAVSNTGEKWLQVEGKDISSYGNVLKIKAGDLEQMKQTVIDNNWSSVTFLANGEAQFKKFYFQLNQTHLSKSKAADSIWIYNPDGHQAGRKTTDIDLKHWIRVEGKNLEGFDSGFKHYARHSNKVMKSMLMLYTFFRKPKLKISPFKKEQGARWQNLIWAPAASEIQS